MKRYAVFANDDYYPSGGWGDFRNWFDSPEDAVAAAAEFERKHGYWSHIVDLETGEYLETGGLSK